MKATEFCYWLQGLFEINNPTELNSKQIELIKKHLEMVFVHEKTPSEHMVFCRELNGFLKFGQIQEMHATLTNALKEELNKLFVHVAESVYTPSYPTRMGLQVSERSERINC